MGDFYPFLPESNLPPVGPNFERNLTIILAIIVTIFGVWYNLSDAWKVAMEPFNHPDIPITIHYLATPTRLPGFEPYGTPTHMMFMACSQNHILFDTSYCPFVKQEIDDTCPTNSWLAQEGARGSLTTSTLVGGCRPSLSTLRDQTDSLATPSVSPRSQTEKTDSGNLRLLLATR